MSTGVDQRSKGQQNQVSNGTEKQPEFDYMQGPPPLPQNYGSAQMSSPNADPYMSSYYTQQYMFPNMGGQDGVGQGWSNGGDPMSLLGGYGQVNGGEYMGANGMYGGAGGFDYNHFNWGFNGEFQPWVTTQQQQGGGGRKDDQQQQQQQQHAAYPDPYYMQQQQQQPPRDSYGNVNGEVESRESVETGMKSMSLNEKGDGRDSSGLHHSNSATSSGSGGGGGGGGGSSSGAPKKMSWASVASQPARPQPQVKPKSIPRAPLMPGKHGNMDIGMWDGKNNPANKANGGQQQARQAWGAGRGRMAPPAPYSSGPGGPGGGPGMNYPSLNSGGGSAAAALKANELLELNPVLSKLRSSNSYNPKEFNLNPKGARFFIIKSYSEDDIHRSIKYSIWCSTEHGNKRLDSSFHEREGKGPVYFFFSVNGSGHFCGMAQMMTPVDYHSSSSVWAQDKWKGQMEVKWIYVKDVPNSQLRHIRLENNENKPVTNSRDTQEAPPEKGKQVLKILHHYRHTTSIFDDFNHYEKRQEDEKPVEKPEKDDQKEESNDDQQPREERREPREDRRDDRERRGGERRDDRRQDDRRQDDRRQDDRRGGRSSNYH